MKTVPSPILRAFVPILFFLVNILALYLLLRGHDLPGGGFIAGLASAISWILLALTLPSEKIRTFLQRDTLRLATWGLAIAFIMGILPMFWGEAFLSQNFLSIFGLSSTLIFDIGIYLLVLGVVGKVGFSLRRATQGLDPLTSHEIKRYGGVHDD